VAIRSYAHDPNTGTVGSLTPTVSGRGTSRPAYQYPEIGLSEKEIDEYIDSVLEDEEEIDIHAKIDTHVLGLSSPTPRGSKQYYVGGNNIFEYAGDHKNYARKGISPYKQPKHSGPPLGTGGSNQAFRTTGNFLGIGSQFGWSRPHKIATSIEDENIWHISKIKDPMERSFLRHNNRVKKVLNLLKEYLDNEINAFECNN